MFSFSMFGEAIPPRPFNTQYRCYSVSMFAGSDKQSLENGGKIIMPPSALDILTRLNIEYPMLFKLTNRKENRHTHCGVLEFVADEGKTYIPYWMMRNLLLDEGDFIQIESVSLPTAEFSKFEPQNVEFLDISNQKAVLENALRNFACLTTDDVIAIKYNERIYEMRVLEVKPGNAVSIIECDMNVEFAAPIGYQEPQKHEDDVTEMDEDQSSLHEPQGFPRFSWVRKSA
ncbi:Ubiquitin fusion degradation protein 1-like protein [Armadillidium nasatum]|uniref:Ubiquitin fusion degradation protein 1 homolog n=1 Tax=Armadillidium nasatum TaxID=96803 RepID=A0A5N5SSY7_9CRUS|nr:Ubiquitin fusion degradation protein 1-like protein [Armadillidium nasatum]